MPEDDSKVEETHNGVKKEGDLEEIKDFAEEVGEAIEGSDFKEETVKEYEEWMPDDEDGKEDIKEKTIEAAATPQKKIEEESEGAVKDLENASGKIADAGKKIKNRENPDAELKDASWDFLKPLFSRVIRLFRWLEKTVYSRLMLPLNAYYFDSEDVAVDVKEKRNGDYEMDVKTTQEDKKEALKKEISDLEG